MAPECPLTMALWRLSATASGGADCNGDKESADGRNAQPGKRDVTRGERGKAGGKLAHEVRREGAQGALGQKPDSDAGKKDGERAHRPAT